METDTQELSDDRYDYLRGLVKEGDAAYDRHLLALAGGALGLSVTFVKNLATSPPVSLTTLGWSWSMLVLSLVSTVFSFRAAAFTARRAIDGKDIKKLNWFNDALGMLGGVAFVVGLGLMARFAYLNIT
jgi:hypothetical protein